MKNDRYAPAMLLNMCADLIVAPYVWDLDSHSTADAAEIIERGRAARRSAAQDTEADL